MDVIMEVIVEVIVKGDVVVMEVINTGGNSG